MAKKKTLLIVPVVLLISLFISIFTPISAMADDSNYEPRLTAPNSSIPYYSSELNYYFRTGTGMPNCVAYAYGRIYEMNGEAPLLTHGNAGDWYGMNKRGGYYDYGQTPKLGAVACWSNHVAVVEKINDDGNITFSESHWHGNYFNTVTYSNVYSHYGQRFYGYIYTYNGGVTKELENKLLTASNEKNEGYKSEKIEAKNVNNQFTLAKMDVQSKSQQTSESTKSSIPLLQDKLHS